MNRSGIALPVIVVLAFLPACTRAQTASITGTGVQQAALQFDNLYFLGAANNTAFLHTRIHLSLLAPRSTTHFS